ncbi:EAL domain, c-di-GMP-specific phosphodiesterase class I (or its enzymatically inactive variant) [Paracoccus halophilus]|uniref:EAL domain, c-di-GMP-specific phosphodiesterase class I (Or its enzymatically inactive variant) n=1 Tax=Paracoccus halophilus TaxID=376733 RepID=A0A099F0G5_9RHOB|nr:EAL domain-containing protein [Paracoccus halophilus]KGJ03637.1 hypothetical protein IT41_13565 [Paracoccus halophilus]SFA57966.1 EAL domain, c-di-GMP-specific phosphodiesterase class I (or its enzymatically inactive variant) [Paracoccus halophilus]
MAYGIGALARGLARLLRYRTDKRACARLALVLRLDNPGMLRGSIGQAQLDRLLDRLTLRLVSELRLLPRARSPGSAEICGVFADPQSRTIPGLLAEMPRIVQTRLDLPGLQITPAAQAVIVGDVTGRHDIGALYAAGRAELRSREGQAGTDRFRHVAMPPSAGQDAAGAGAVPRDPAGDLRVMFRPQICCDTGRVAALRASLRVMDPSGGQVDLAEVAAHLDRETLAVLLQQGLRRILSALRGWDRLGVRVPFISLALPEAVLADPLTADTIIWELDRQELAAARLELEVTEPTGLSTACASVGDNLKRLAATGCRLALGEFGTGSSGLADLRSFAIQRVRIAGDLIAGCDRCGDPQRMILAVLALAEHLNLATLGDDVRTPEEYAFLSQMGFDAVQGDAVAPWLDPEEVDAFLMCDGDAPSMPFDLLREA